MKLSLTLCPKEWPKAFMICVPKRLSEHRGLPTQNYGHGSERFIGTASDSVRTNPCRYWIDPLAIMLAIKRAFTLDYLCVRALCHREDRGGPLWYGNPHFLLQRGKFRSQLCSKIMSHGLLGCQRRPGGLPPRRRDSGSSSLLQRGGKAEKKCSKRAWKVNVGFTILCTTALRDRIHQTRCSMSDAITRGITVSRSVAGQWL